MAYQFLKPETIVETYRTSKKYTEGLTDKFTEYERLAANKPHSSIPKEYPKTTDGTTASIIRKTPHRIIQQLPTGKVRSTQEDWLSVVAEFIYYNKIIPNANEDYALLQKCWSVVERFLTFGYCGTYAPFVEHNGYFCSDLRLIYWGDVFVQPGKLSDSDSNYIFIRSWWQTADIDALIASQEKIDKKNRTWDVDALKKVKDIVVEKDEKAKTPADKARAVNEAGGVELITGFQRGVGAKFYTFHMHNTGTGSEPNYEGTIVRTKINKDPRGEMPVSFAYGDIDGSNPFGRSIVELVGGLQNLMDSEMQMYQYNRALQLNPPLIKRGNFSKNKIKFVPNIIIDVGSDPNSNVEPLTIDTTALSNFPNNYGLMKSQMLNLLASPDTSISSDVGNPGFSKTPQGVEASRANLSVDDNYVRKQFETWFERWSETAINLYFAEREGVEELQLDDQTIVKLERLAEDGKFDMGMVSEEGKIRINYSTATEKLKFEVDATTSKVEDDVKKLESLQGLTALLSKTDFLKALVPPEKQMELWNAIVSTSGVGDPKNLMLTDKDKQAAIERMSQPQDDTREYVNVNYKDLPEEQKVAMEEMVGLPPRQTPTTSPGERALDIQEQQQQPQLTPETLLKADEQAHKQEMEKTQAIQQGQPEVSDQEIIAQLQAMGIPEDVIGKALALIHSGTPIEEVMQMIQQVMGGQR